jgi:hypothetical protein
MKMKVLILVSCLVSAAAMGQKSEVRTIGTFKGVKAGQAIDVYLKKGDKESVKIESTGIDPEEIVTEISGSYLKIHMGNGNHRNMKSVKAYVTYVELDKIVATSASNVFSDGTIKSNSMEIHASSAATVEVNIDVNDLQVSASSAADVNIEGKAKTLDGEAGSAGEVDAYGLTAESATVSATSAGSIKVNVSSALDAKASSGGSIRYRGNPSKTNSNSSSGGSVKRSN